MFEALKGEKLMSFGAIVGEALTTSNEFKAGLIIDIDEDETVPIERAP